MTERGALRDFGSVTHLVERSGDDRERPDGGHHRPRSVHYRPANNASADGTGRSDRSPA
jgi:hypothetical protein